MNPGVETSSRPRRTSGLRQIATILATDLPRLARESRTLWLGLIQFVPVVAAIMLIQWLTLDGLHIYTAIVERALFPVLIPIVALFYGGPVLVDEIEQRTLTYLTVRPVSKGTLYLGKWLAGVVLAVALVLVPLALLFAVSTLLGGAEASVSPLLRTALAALCATLGYASVFTAIGVLFARGMVGSIAYFIVFDLIMGQIPVAKLATVRFHVYNIGDFEQLSGVEVLNSLLSSGGFTVPWWGSALATGFWVFVMLGLGVLIFSNRQYAM